MLEFEGLQFASFWFSDREEVLHQDETDGNMRLYKEIAGWAYMTENQCPGTMVTVAFVCSVHRMISWSCQAGTPALLYRE